MAWASLVIPLNMLGLLHGRFLSPNLGRRPLLEPYIVQAWRFNTSEASNILVRAKVRAQGFDFVLALWYDDRLRLD